MTVILPDEGSSLEELHRNFTVEMWKKITSSLKPVYAQVALPRFKADWGKAINDVLTDMGMDNAFSDSADFSGMVEDFDPVEQFHMIIDRPFLYIIDDSDTGSVLFIGSMQNPKDISGAKE